MKTTNTSKSTSNVGAPHIVSPSLVSEFRIQIATRPRTRLRARLAQGTKGLNKSHTFKSGNNACCLETTPTPHAVPTTNDCRWTEKSDLAKSTHQPSDFKVEPDLHLKHIGTYLCLNYRPTHPHPHTNFNVEFHIHLKHTMDQWFTYI